MKRTISSSKDLRNEDALMCWWAFTSLQFFLWGFSINFLQVEARFRAKGSEIPWEIFFFFFFAFACQEQLFLNAASEIFFFFFLPQSSWYCRHGYSSKLTLKNQMKFLLRPEWSKDRAGFKAGWIQSSAGLANLLCCSPFEVWLFF